MNICGVIFDFDGVIVDVQSIIDSAINQYLEKLGVRLTEEEISRYRGQKSDSFWKHVQDKYSLSDDAEHHQDAVRKVYMPIIADSLIHPLPGLRNFISSLKSNNIKIAIASSGASERIHLLLGKIGLGDVFDAVITGDDTTQSKPQPNSFLLAARKLGIKPQECVVIEDSKSGILAAKKSKMFCIGLQYSNDSLLQDLKQSNYIVNNFIEIFGIPEFRKVNLRCNLCAALFDIRGTLIHPYLDQPLTKQLAELLCALLKKPVPVAFVTATSLQSLQKLIIPSLIYSAKSSYALLKHVYFYVDSGTLAYHFDPTLSMVPLDNYSELHFTREEIETLRRLIAETTVRFAVKEDIEIKIKKGQINYYCGGDWHTRLEIARFMQGLITKTLKKRQIYVMVPTSKDTLDIALCKKDTPVREFFSRFSIKNENVLMIGDSFQVWGADYDMKTEIQDALVINVGIIPTSKDVIDFPVKNEAGSRKILATLI